MKKIKYLISDSKNEINKCIRYKYIYIESNKKESDEKYQIIFLIFNLLSWKDYIFRVDWCIVIQILQSISYSSVAAAVFYTIYI